MAKTGSEIKNVELGFESLDSEGVASQIGGLAGGIGDLSASMVLLGDDSESMKEMAANIELAMGISMGMKGAIEGMSAASKLYRTQLKGLTLLQARQNIATKVGAIATKLWAAATTVAGVAMKAFNAILKLNPIGLIIIGLTAAVGMFMAFGGAIKDVIDFALAPFNAAIEGVIDGLQWLGLVESDEAEKAAKAEKKRAKVARKAFKDINKAARESAKVQQEVTDDITSSIDFEIRKRTAAGLDVSKLEKKKVEALREGARLQIEIEEQRIADLAKLVKKELELNGVNFAEAQALLAASSETWAREVLGDQVVNVLKETSEALDAAKDQFKAYGQDLEIIAIEEDKKSSDRRANRTAIEKADAADNQIERIERIKMDALEVAEVEAEIATEKVLTMQEYIDEQEQLEKDKHQRMLDRLAEEDGARQANIDKFQAGLNVLNASADLFVNNEKKRDKIKKALALAQIAIDTARAISSGIAAAAAAGPFPANIAAILSTVAVVLANMASAKKLLSSAGAGSVSLPSGGEVAGGGANISPVSNTSTLTGSMPTSVVSVEEINTVSNKVDAIEQAATIG
jgi:hypothetical protein